VTVILPLMMPVHFAFYVRLFIKPLLPGVDIDDPPHTSPKPFKPLQNHRCACVPLSKQHGAVQWRGIAWCRMETWVPTWSFRTKFRDDGAKARQGENQSINPIVYKMTENDRVSHGSQTKLPMISAVFSFSMLLFHSLSNISIVTLCFRTNSPDWHRCSSSC
jgi:hypothetical protein